MREIDPRDRIGRLKEIITKNKNRVIIKCLMTNLHKILVNSSDKKSTIDHMVSIQKISITIYLKACFFFTCFK